MSLPNFRKRYLLMIFLLLAIISSAIFYGNNTIDISTYTLTSKKITKDNVKILQISDLHCKSFGKAQQILLAQIENISPDISFSFSPFPSSLFLISITSGKSTW